MTGRLPVLAGGLFVGNGLFFLLVGADGFGLFLLGFLLVRLRGFIAHILTFLSGLICLRHVSFSEGIRSVLAGTVIVNDGSNIVRKGGDRVGRMQAGRNPLAHEHERNGGDSSRRSSSSGIGGARRCD